MSHAIFHNPDFVEYVKLLSKLHELIAAGADETPEGDDLRDRMDEPGSRLSAAEVEAVKGISADFYTPTGDSPSGAAIETDAAARDELDAAYLAALERDDLIAAFALLRENAASLSPGLLADMRAGLWRRAGLHPVALRFLTRAVHLEPANIWYECYELDCLETVDPSAAVARATRILDGPGQNNMLRSMAMGVLRRDRERREAAARK